MKTKNTLQRMFLTVSVFMVPALLLLGTWLLTNRARSDWASFTALCARSWETFMGFVSHNGTLWIAAVAIVFSLGLLRGLVFLIGQIRNVRRLRNQFQNKSLPKHARLAAKEGVVLVNDRRPFAVTIGFIKPVIYLSKGLLDRLAQDELHSVLAHEQYHLNHHHPLALLLANTFRACLFFLPVLKNVVSFATLRLEFLADQAAILATSRNTLASALLKTLKGDSSKSFPVSVAALAQGADRVTAIIDSNKKPVLQLSKWPAAVSLIVIASISFIFFKPQPSQAHHPQVNQAEGADSSMNTNYCHSPSQSFLSLVGLASSELYHAPEQSTVRDFATLRMTSNQE